MFAADDARVSGGDAPGASAQVVHAAAIQLKEDAVDLEAARLDGLQDGQVGHQRLDASLDVELGYAHGARLGVGDGGQLVRIRSPERSERSQPDVEHAANRRVAEGSVGPTTARVAAQDDVLDLEVGDGVLDHRRRVDVAAGHNVADVAVHEYIARLQAEDGRLGTAGV